MAAESNIDPEAGWFAGEDKTLHYALPEWHDDIGDWTVEWTLYPVGSDPVVLGGSAILADPGDPDAGVPSTIAVAVPAAATADLSTDDTHQYALRRTDPGARSVLAFGAIALRSEVLE